MSGETVRVAFKAPGVDGYTEWREISLPSGAVLSDLITTLGNDISGQLNRSFIAVNDVVVRREGYSDRKLHDKDEVLLVPPLALG
jgi:molybdopterin converting factor small subunit